MENWDDYRIFQAIAQAGTLTAAAAALGLTQPSIGRRLSAMESRLGEKLFLRESRRLSLTDFGRDLLPHAERMGEAAAALDRRINARTEDLAGTIRIATTEGMGSVWLPPRLPRLQRQHPALRVEIVMGSRPTDLTRQEADIALRMFAPPESDFRTRPMGRLAYGLFASRGYLAENGTPESADALGNHRLIGFAEAGPRRPEMAWLHALGLEDNIRTCGNNVLAQAGAAAAGLGIAPLPCYLARQTGGLVQILEDSPMPGRELWLVSHADLRPSARINAVWQFLRQEIIADTGLLETEA